MKDPLRYYLSEGFVVLFYYPNPEVFGKFSGRYRCTDGASKKIRVVEFAGKKCLAVENVAYPICSDFWLDYGVRVENEDEAKARIIEWAKETNELHEIFVKQAELS